MKKNLINKFAPFHAYEGTEDIDFAKELPDVGQFILAMDTWFEKLMEK